MPNVEHSRFVERSIVHCLALLRFTLKPHVQEAIERLPFFDPKSRDERHFSETSDGFC